MANICMLSKKYIVGCILLLGVAYTGWLLFQSSTFAPDVTQGKQFRPDIFMQDVKVVETDETGKVVKHLTSPKLVHYPKDDKTQITQPVYVVYQDNQKQPWVIKATMGTSYNGGKKIVLQDNVNIHESQGTNNQDTLITTSSLTYFPKKDLASTKKPVTIQKPNLKITAIGMNAFLAEKRVDLLSNTRGIYVPDKRQS